MCKCHCCGSGFLDFLYDFLSLKNNVNVLSKCTKQKKFRIFFCILKVNDEKSRSVSQWYRSADPDPCQIVTDPQDWQIDAKLLLGLPRISNLPGRNLSGMRKRQKAKARPHMAYMITAKEGQLKENIFKITVETLSPHVLTKTKFHFLIMAFYAYFAQFLNN